MWFLQSFSSKILLKLITNSKDVSPKVIFISDEGYWNLSLNSFIHLQLEADITPDILYFAESNKEYLEKDKNHRLTTNEQGNIWRSTTPVGIKLHISVTETLLVFVSEIWYRRNACEPGCNADISYLYIEAFTSKYRRTSYNWSLKTRRTIRIPSILPIGRSESGECCLGLLHLHAISNRKNEMILTLTKIDSDKQRKVWLYNLFTGHQTSLSVGNNPSLNLTTTWTPFVKDNILHFVYTYKPLNIMQCSSDNGKCKIISKIEIDDSFSFLRGGTQLVQFHDTDYYVGIVRITVSCTDCGELERPHIIVLSTISGIFRLVYISEPLMIDNIPMLAPFSMLQQTNSSDFCYGIIRTMTPGLIMDWEWPKDKVTFTLSVNKKKAFLVSIVGIGKIVQSIISAVKSEYSHIVFNNNASIKMISYSKSRALHYCQSLSQRNKLKYKIGSDEKEYLSKKVIIDKIDSPTYPTFPVVSNVDGKSLKFWIASDNINFGLIGRYLTDYNLVNNNRGRGSPLMIDAGGNHGTYALYGAMLNQIVHVFEVLPKYWVVIEKSLHINAKFEKLIFLHKCGVSDNYSAWNVLPEDGTTRLDFQKANEPDTNSRNRSHNRSLDQSQKNLTVIEAYPLDQFIFQQVSVMKIDVEGFEIRALKGAIRSIRIFGVGAILIEIASYRWMWNNVTIEDGISVLEDITSIGHYSCYIIARNDTTCPASIISKISGVTEVKDLIMMSMENGRLEAAPNIYRLNGWSAIITHMKNNEWSCNFWLERTFTESIIKDSS